MSTDSSAIDFAARPFHISPHRSSGPSTDGVVRDWDMIAGTVQWDAALVDTFGHELPGSADATMEWWLVLVHPDDRSHVLGSLNTALASDATSWSEEYRFRRGDGSYARVRDSSRLHRGGNGRPVRVVGSIIDLSNCT